MSTPHRLIGLATFTLAIAFNIPYALLAARFDYPDILRRPAAEVLASFQAGGAGLVAIWYAFLLCALALVGLAPALAAVGTRRGLATAAALLGALAGVTQAIGLSRWVFAVPMLAAGFADPAGDPARAEAIAVVFEVLNLWAGVAVGEHLGQALTVAWIAVTVLQFPAAGRVVQGAGWLAVAGIGFGLGEGLALAFGLSGAVFSLGTITGYLAMSVWMVGLGLALWSRGAGVAPRVAA